MIACSVSDSPVNSSPTRMSPSRVKAASLISPSSRMLTASANRRNVNDYVVVDQLPGLRMMERDSETEHGDVDDLAIAATLKGIPQQCGRSRPRPWAGALLVGGNP